MYVCVCRFRRLPRRFSFTRAYMCNSRVLFHCNRYPFLYGPPFQSFAIAVGGTVMVSYYRKLFNITKYRVVMNLGVALPAAFPAMILHHTFIYSRVRTQRAQCELCLCAKNAAIQMCMGGVATSCLSVLAATVAATRTYSYDVPHPAQKSTVAKFFAQLMRFFGRHLVIGAKPIAGVCLAQFLIGDLVCWAEMKNVQMLNARIVDNFNAALRQQQEQRWRSAAL